MAGVLNNETRVDDGGRGAGYQRLEAAFMSVLGCAVVVRGGGVRDVLA